jgi:hypothetical protein
MPLMFSKSVADAAAGTLADGRGDFDFLSGRWTVKHKRLGRRLADDTSWDEFSGVCESLPVIGGLANIDDNYLELPGGTYRAATLRLFDPKARLWSIWWIDSRSMRLEPPVHGRFENAIGTFFGDDMHEGRPIRVRFLWLEIGPDSARWEQAFSPDGGGQWETNWIMRFQRAG